MKIIQKVIKTPDNDTYYLKHLQIVNQIIPNPMSQKELEVLSKFMALTGDLTRNRFSTTGRKIVMEKLDLSPGGLGNYLKSLEEKGLIYKNDFHAFEIKEFLLPESNNQGYQFKIIRNE